MKPPPRETREATVTAIIPAYNEATTVGAIVTAVKPSVDEVIVVDSCSVDDTASIAAEAGARVGTVKTPGKHYALRAGVIAAQSDDLVFIDADYRDPSPTLAQRLVDGLYASPHVSISKGYYDILKDERGEGGGRLTELTARPLIALCLPHLANVYQPLAGEFAVHRKDILDMPFAPGAAVDLGILIHCAVKGEIVQVDLGLKVHKHRSLPELSISAVEVAATLLRSVGVNFPLINYHQFLEHSLSASFLKLDPLPPVNSGVLFE